MCAEEARLLQPAPSGAKGRFSIWLVCEPCNRHLAYIIILSLQSFYKVNDFISLLQMKKLRFGKINNNYINVSHRVTIPLKNNNFLHRKTTPTIYGALCARSCLKHFRLPHFFFSQCNSMTLCYEEGNGDQTQFSLLLTHTLNHDSISRWNLHLTFPSYCKPLGHVPYRRPCSLFKTLMTLGFSPHHRDAYFNLPCMMGTLPLNYKLPEDGDHLLFPCLLHIALPCTLPADEG